MPAWVCRSSRLERRPRNMDVLASGILLPSSLHGAAVSRAKTLRRRGRPHGGAAMSESLVLVGIVPVALSGSSGLSEPIQVPWPLPAAEFSVAVDGLSTLFLIPIFLISALGSVYGLGYWDQRKHPGECPQAASVLRLADRRHGAAGDCPERYSVS